MNVNHWDVVLLLVVSAQASLVAHVRQPQTKALLLSFPFPISVAFLSVGRPVDATNMLGLVLLLFFMHGIRWLYVHRRVPIVWAILSCALAYGVVGSVIARFLPEREWVFWTSCVLVFFTGAVLLRLQPHREEPAHRTALPMVAKIPVIIAVIAALVLAKQWLRGFMTMFPMVSVVAAYEARHSLWTMSRQILVIMMVFCVMLIVMHLAQPHTGPYWALVFGWISLAVALPAGEKLRRSAWGRGRR